MDWRCWNAPTFTYCCSAIYMHQPLHTAIVPFTYIICICTLLSDAPTFAYCCSAIYIHQSLHTAIVPFTYIICMCTLLSRMPQHFADPLWKPNYPPLYNYWSLPYIHTCGNCVREEETLGITIRKRKWDNTREHILKWYMLLVTDADFWAWKVGWGHWGL